MGLNLHSRHFSRTYSYSLAVSRVRFSQAFAWRRARKGMMSISIKSFKALAFPTMQGVLFSARVATGQNRGFCERMFMGSGFEELAVGQHRF